jgi:hypothetical protein
VVFTRNICFKIIIVIFTPGKYGNLKIFNVFKGLLKKVVLKNGIDLNILKFSASGLIATLPPATSYPLIFRFSLSVFPRLLPVLMGKQRRAWENQGPRRGKELWPSRKSSGFQLKTVLPIFY